MIETTELPVSDLRTFHKNPRVGDVEAIKASLTANGQYRAIVVNRGTHTGRSMEVLAGNHTLKAARDLGWEKITAHLLDVDEDQAARIVLADNRTADLAGMDDTILLELLKTLDTLEGTGYTAEDVLLLDSANDVELLTDPDELPEDPETRAKLGDVWQLGNHVVVCGDSTEQATYEKLLGEDQVDVVWTDPPYGVSYVGGTKDALTIQNDGAEGLESLLSGVFPLMHAAMRPGAAFYVAHANTKNHTFETTLREAGLQIRQHLVWVKNTLVLGRSDYHYQHEPILYGFAPAPAGYGRLGRGGEHWHGTDAETTVREVAEDVLVAVEGSEDMSSNAEDALLLVDPEALRLAVEEVQRRSTVLRYDKPAASRLHPTMKPVDLVADLLRNSAKRGDKVLDPFGGSGSTLIAAEKLGLHARLIELDPRFVDAIIARWEEATGGTAQLVS